MPDPPACRLQSAWPSGASHEHQGPSQSHRASRPRCRPDPRVQRRRRTRASTCCRRRSASATSQKAVRRGLKFVVLAVFVARPPRYRRHLGARHRQSDGARRRAGEDAGLDAAASANTPMSATQQAILSVRRRARWWVDRDRLATATWRSCRRPCPSGVVLTASSSIRRQVDGRYLQSTGAARRRAHRDPELHGRQPDASIDSGLAATASRCCRDSLTRRPGNVTLSEGGYTADFTMHINSDAFSNALHG